MSVPDSAKGAVALALGWAGVVALIGITLTRAAWSEGREHAPAT
ncbi:MAG TPA: hypothetical protein VJ975_04440 [Candidatus Limnocylindria bacterium]|nr:hypothetical protein [Candidatus Limnocylindria bacterium]